MGKNAKLKEKQEWSNEKLHLENARKFLGIYFIDPEDKEFKQTIKNGVWVRVCVCLRSGVCVFVRVCVKSKKQVFEEARTWQGGWGPQGRPVTGGGGLARVPNLRRVLSPSLSGWHMQERKDELTSCLGTV